jgi:hypothetical protein
VVAPAFFAYTHQKGLELLLSGEAAALISRVPSGSRVVAPAFFAYTHQKRPELLTAVPGI